MTAKRYITANAPTREIAMDCGRREVALRGLEATVDGAEEIGYRMGHLVAIDAQPNADPRLHTWRVAVTRNDLPASAPMTTAQP